MAIMLNQEPSSQSMLSAFAAMQQRSRQDAPALPAGYASVGMPQPLSRDCEAWWTALAYDASYSCIGQLIYEQERKVAFLDAEEAILCMLALFENCMDLLAQCSDSFIDEVTCYVLPLWTTWIHEQQKHVADTQAPTLCAWCWYEQHPDQPFPPAASSACCDGHKRLVKGGAA